MAHDELVLGVDERVRGWQDRHALGDEGAQVLGRDASWSKVRRRRPAQPVAGRRGCRGSRSPRPPTPPRPGRRGRREHAQRLSERDRGLMCHAGQLPAADHRDRREAHRIAFTHG